MIVGSPRASELPEVISISRDRLSLVVTRFMQMRKEAGDWTAPLGIALSLLVLLPLTKFQERLGISAQQWQTVFVLAAAVSTVWFIVAVIRSIRAPRAADLLREIAQHADVLDDHRGLYLLKALDEQDSYKLLVYWDIVWECYLLPHVDIRAIDMNDQSTLGPLSMYAARKLGVEPADLEVRVLREITFHTRKFSAFYKREKSYTFEMIHVRLSGPPPHLLEEEFVVGGTKYRWMTLGGLAEDPATAAKNGDVIRHLENNFVQLFVQVPDSVPKFKLRS